MQGSQPGTARDTCRRKNALYSSDCERYIYIYEPVYTYIYIYILGSRLGVFFSRPVRARRFMAGKRARSASAADTRAFQKCLKIRGASDAAKIQIWRGAATHFRGEAQKAPATSACKKDITAYYACWLDCCDWRELPAVDGSAIRVAVLNVQRGLQRLARESPEWGAALARCQGAAAAILELEPVVYCDEVACGNVLAAIKSRKKITGFYFSFKNLRDCIRAEPAWVTLCAVQKADIDRITGGLSALASLLLDAIHAPSHLAGFPVALPEGPRWVRIGQRSALMADHDAIRLIFGLKGAAGTVPCISCRNVVRKGHGLSAPNLVELHEWRQEKFLGVSDRVFFRLADELLALTNKQDIKFRSMALGLNRVESGLMFNPRLRCRLPPSAATVDLLHTYYANGCASWECGLAMDYLGTRGITPADLLGCALASKWLRPNESARATYWMKAIFHEKMWAPGLFKGNGNQTRPLVFLLFYYLFVLLRDDADAEALLHSFSLLKQCCGELRQLQACGRVLTRGDAEFLDVSQSLHMEAFYRAWGPDEVKPKHHARMHMPASIAILGFVPDCSLHEKKHQAMKAHGNVDRQKARLGDGEAFQKALLPRLISITADTAAQGGMTPGWRLLPPIRPASARLRAKLGESSLMWSASAAACSPARVRAGEVLLSSDRRQGCVAQYFVAGGDGSLRLALTPLVFLAQQPWGTTWRQLDREDHVPARFVSTCFKPAAWRHDGATVICLH